jgi:hypothetical protein
VAFGVGLLSLSLVLWQKKRQQEQEAPGTAPGLPRAQEAQPSGAQTAPEGPAGLPVQSETLRLPNETSPRAQEMAAATQGGDQPRETEAPSVPAVINAIDEAFEAKLKTSIPEGQTLAFGGWTTESGKRAVAFLHPAIEPGTGTNAQIVIRATLMEVPPEVWGQLGLTDIKADPDLSSQTGLMSQDRAESLIAALTDQSNCLILNRPAIQTSDGVRATLFVGQVTASNQMRGQLLDCLPQIDPDGRTINLSFILKSGPQTETQD